MTPSESAKQIEIEHVFTQVEFDRFAQLSGDNNPIHVDAEFSRRARFGRTVAHGLLLCSRLRALIDQLVPGGRLLDQSVMFEAPTYAGDKMCFSARIVAQDGDIAKFEVEVKRVGDGIVTCSGQGSVAL
jgi:acyl dehydratase